MARYAANEAQVIPARDLSRADLAAWSDLQLADPAYDSPFFRPEFTSTLATARDDVEVGVVRHGSQPVCFFPFQRNGWVARPVAAPASDFHGPVIRSGVQIDPAQLLRDCRLAAWHFTDLTPERPDFAPYIWSRERAPFIDVSANFSEYLAKSRQAGSKAVRRTLQKRRKLASEVGGVRFELATRDPMVLQQLLLWKAQQCRQRGQFELVSSHWLQKLLDQLLHVDGPELTAHLAVMYAANELQAAFYCLRSRHVLHLWIIAHRPQLGRYSPGYQLLVQLIEQAGAMGIRRIDLGRGNERFKSEFATGSSLVAEGSVDLRPVQRHVGHAWHRFRRGSAGTLLHQQLQVPWNFAKRLRDRLLFE